jgi:hypothetical protein
MGRLTMTSVPVANFLGRFSDAQSSQSRPADGLELVDLLGCEGLCCDRIGKTNSCIDIREAVRDVVKLESLLDILEASPLHSMARAITSLDWISGGGDGLGDIGCRCLLLAGHECVSFV